MEEHQDKNKGPMSYNSIKYAKETKSNPKTTGSKLKERWLLTRKTWRYMSDAGKKLFPDSVSGNRKEEIPKLEENFQKVSDNCDEYIIWDPNRKNSETRGFCDRIIHRKWDNDRGRNSLSPDSSSQINSSHGKETPFSVGDYGWALPSDMYSHLIRNLGTNTFHKLTSSLLEDDLIEEDEFDYDEEEDGELVWIDDRTMRSIGSQTDPYLDMCIQTDEDVAAEDFVNVGAETREETEAAVAYERTLMQETLATEGGILPTQAPDHIKQVSKKHSLQGSLLQPVSLDAQSSNLQTSAVLSTQIPNKQSVRIRNLSPRQQLQQTSDTHQISLQSQPPVLKKFWARRESLTAKADIHQSGTHYPEKVGKIQIEEKEIPIIPTKIVSLKPSTVPSHSQVPKQEPLHKRKQQNVFKMGLRCDMDAIQGHNQPSSEKTPVDKFKTLNYDKQLRNIKSKWVPSAEEEEFIKYLQRENELEKKRLLNLKIQEIERIKMKEREEKRLEKEREKEKLKQNKENVKLKEKEKKKKKSRSIQVGEPLPQFIINSFRINSPVQIIDATKRRLRRFSSKADSGTGSEGSMSPTGRISPRFSICILDDNGSKDLIVSEAGAYKLSQMGIPFIYKKCDLETVFDGSENEASLRDNNHSSGGMHPRALSAVQASGYISQMLYNLRAGRFTNPFAGAATHLGGRASEMSQKLTQNLLHNLLSTVMQRSRTSSGGHTSRMVAKRIWRTRSKSQSRASAGTTSIWTPMGNCTWMSVTGRIVSLEPTSLIYLSELERLSLQKISLSKLHPLNLGCPVKIPKESSSSSKKRRPYLLKRKARSGGLFENKKEETKGTTGGLVFGLSLNQCLENEKIRLREAAEKEGLILAASAVTPTREDAEGSLSRKSSHSGSHTSFSSLFEVTKQSTTGSLESLNLERKRPSLGSDVMIVGTRTTSLDLLMVEPILQVPTLISTCCKFLEGHGLHTLGIFRVSPSKKRVRQLREEFDSGKEVVLTEEHCPHDIATLLKEFFRDLPDPLLTRELYEPLLTTQKIRNRKLQLEAIQHLVQLLPRANRDTLFTLLNFLTTIAEHASNAEGDTSQGNKMDSSNLATIFAPNILHQMKPGSDPLSTSEMASQAEERIDVINVVRTMIDHNKELFEISPELLDETYQHLMDSHPDALDILLRRKCTGPDELDFEVDTNSSVFEGSDASSPPLPRSPTDHHEFEKFRAGIVLEDLESPKKERTFSPETPGTDSTRRRGTRDGEEELRKKGEVTPTEEKSWFRKREKSTSREIDRGPEPTNEKTRWFRRREKPSPKASEDRTIIRQGSDKTKERTILKQEIIKTRERLSSQESVESQCDTKNKMLSEHEKLKVPEPSVRRLSSPEVDNFGVITASLKIPVPLHQQPTPIAVNKEKETPLHAENGKLSKTKCRLKEADITSSRQRAGSSDSFLGQTITGSLSFQPLSKKDGDKRSHDSILSSSSMGIYTMSPSERDTPNSDYHFQSETSSVSGTFSPPMWTSPDSGTPGLSPPNSPPPQRRRSRIAEESSLKASSPLTHSTTHTFGSKSPLAQRTRERPRPQGTSSYIRSSTLDNFQSHVTKEKKINLIEMRAKDEKDINKKFTRKGYSLAKSPTGQTSTPTTTRQPSTESPSQLWKRWEIISSDPTEPETFV